MSEQGKNTPTLTKEDDEFSLRWKVAMLTENVENLNAKIDSLRIIQEKDVEKIVQRLIQDYRF